MDSGRKDKMKTNELHPMLTRCYECHYEALTWHEDTENPRPCRKCGGKLEIIAKEKWERQVMGKVLKYSFERKTNKKGGTKRLR